MSFSFRSIILDQIPYFDARLFETIVRSMPNLESVGISRCILLDVTQLTPLIQAVIDNPRDLNCEEYRYVKLDFAPYFFDGPNHSCRHGSYGITHNEPSFNSTKAVFALIMANLEKAHRIGMDLLSKRSSFWHFVKRLPGPDPLWAFKARDAIFELYRDRSNVPPQYAMHVQRVRQQAVDDLFAALSGDKTEPVPLPASEVYRYGPIRFGYWRQKKACEECNFAHYKGFFNLNQKVCDACKMLEFRDTMEFSHLRQYQRSALDYLLQGFDPKFDNIKDLVDVKESEDSPFKENLKNAHEAVLHTDRAWLWHLMHEVNAKHPEKYAYPDPENVNPVAASLRRWAYSNETLHETDFRFGGPQCIHPGHSHSSTTRTMLGFEHPEREGPEIFEHFIVRTFAFTPRVKEILMEAYRQSDDGEEHPQEYLEMAMVDRDQRKFAQIMAWIEQNRFDRDVWHVTAAGVEDNVYSLIGPYHRAWNRDYQWKKDDIVHWWKEFRDFYRQNGKS